MSDKDETEKWELQLELAMLKDAMKNNYKPQTEQDALNPFAHESKEERIARISKDPKPQWSAPPVRDYATTEKHYILCVNAEKANESLPDAKNIYNSPHKLGNFLISDRLVVPDGWIKTPPRGAVIETIKEEHPEVYEVLKSKKVQNF